MGSVLLSVSLVFTSCGGGGGGGNGGNGSGAWVQVGSQVSPAGAYSEDPAMLVIGSTPVVGYRHASFRTYLNVWNGTDWGTTKPDPTNNSTNSSSYSTPDFCSNGTDIYMAYSQEGGTFPGNEAFYDRIFVYKWNSGSGWAVQNGGNEVSIPWNVTDGGVNAWEPAIACTANLPVVSWVEDDLLGSDGDYDAWVATVSPTNAVRSTANTREATSTWTADVRTAGITADSSGNVYLAQWEQNGSVMDRTDLYVTKYNGSFSALGGSISADYDSNNLSVPSLALMGSDVYVAYSEANATDYTRHIYVKKYSSGSWTTVGGGPVSAFSGSHYDSANPDLLVVNGRLYLAWEESDQYDGPFVFVAYWNGSSWVIDGDKLNVDLSNTSHDPSLAYSSSDGYLYVAFEEYTDGMSHIFVKRKKV